MKKTKTDPVKDFQKQAVEQRVCLFYVADRVKGILEDSKTEEQLRHFKHKVIKNKKAYDRKKHNLSNGNS